MPNNYVLLERIELNASAASVTFANIPQTGYTDLKVVASYRGTTAQVYEITALRFNGLTTNLSSRSIEGSGSAASSFTNPSIYFGAGNGATSTANTFSNIEAYIPNYTSSNQKSVSIDAVGETNGTTIYMQLTAGLWTGTAAITSVEIVPTGSFVQYSTFSLYALAATGTTPTIAPKASGGNKIDYDGTYWIHTFNTNGTFTPQIGLTCDYLVVAGGGGGGSDQAGGGGGGGYRTETATFTALTNYSCTVGGGGAGGTSSGNGTQGVSSVFNTVTSAGGGYGSGYGANAAGGNGGSGGGTSGLRIFSGGSGNTPSTSPSQGNNGGATTNGSHRGAGGGGGGGTGSSGGVAFTGAGGAGTTSSISGTSVERAGGGSGGGFTGDTIGAVSGGGGAGGTGASGLGTPGTVGTVNTGGGGGGGGYNAAVGGAGGSGIVIIRYLA
jgi:hypothetical protein